jgi:hypothetical protein
VFSSSLFLSSFIFSLIKLFNFSIFYSESKFNFYTFSNFIIAYFCNLNWYNSFWEDLLRTLSKSTSNPSSSYIFNNFSLCSLLVNSTFDFKSAISSYSFFTILSDPGKFPPTFITNSSVTECLSRAEPLLFPILLVFLVLSPNYKLLRHSSKFDSDGFKLIIKIVWEEYVMQFCRILVNFVSLYGTDFDDLAIIYKHLDRLVRDELIRIAS